MFVCTLLPELHSQGTTESFCYLQKIPTQIKLPPKNLPDFESDKRELVVICATNFLPRASITSYRKSSFTATHELPPFSFSLSQKKAWLKVTSQADSLAQEKTRGVRQSSSRIKDQAADHVKIALEPIAVSSLCDKKLIVNLIGSHGSRSMKNNLCTTTPPLPSPKQINVEVDVLLRFPKF